MLYCASNKLRDTFAQCSTVLKNIFVSSLLHACVPANCGADKQSITQESQAEIGTRAKAGRIK